MKNMLNLRHLRFLLAQLILLLIMLSSSYSLAQSFEPIQGMASWYGPKFAGRLTANGEIFDPSELTAAHKTLPFGTLVRVTNTTNNMSVVVRINDRGPFIKQRVIDLSRFAAEQIDMIGSGTAEVIIEEVVVEESNPVEVVAIDDSFQQVGMDSSLYNFNIISSRHRVGELLVLGSSLSSQKLLVRVVANSSPEGDLGIYVSPELFANLGEQVSIISDR